MTILYPSPVLVKPGRPFGKGILASRPVYSVPFTQSDLDWLAADNARRENALHDALAGESSALSLMESGLPCC